MTSTHPVWIVIASLLIALVPILIGVATSFIKVSIVLGMLKSGIGAQQVPGAIVTMALSFALTLYIMNPTIEKTLQIAESIDFAALSSEMELSSLSKLAPLITPWREFMTLHAGERELEALKGIEEATSTANASTLELPKAEAGAALDSASGSVADGSAAVEELPLRVLMTAFVLTELKEAFAMGFVLLLPFLVIDLVVANILAGMGMFMLSPVLVSLPLKLILFVLADGWILLTRGLITSYAVG